MRISQKTIEQLRIIINGDDTSDYRSGPKLVSFFNDLGFNDKYGQGFPSRWAYTEDRLNRINGTPELDKCLRSVFAVINYVGRIDVLDKLIAEFNQYLAFDKWQVVRDNDTITFKRLDRVIVDPSQFASKETNETEFLKQTFDIDIDALNLDTSVTAIIKSRLLETEKCINNEAPLSAVFMIGSIMEGMLLGIATAYPQSFNQARSAPKDQKTGKTKKFPDWTLNNLIDTAAEIGILNIDVKKFSHALRDFRNYIHPYSQMASDFSPDQHTALICFQVLKAAIILQKNSRKQCTKQI